MTAPFKVDFLGIGSGKCGSTWLYENLVKHPQISANNLKELNYFSDLYDEHSFEWYVRQFGRCDASKLKGEFSVTYLTHPAAPERVRRHFPDVKLLAIVRDPVRRTFSNYLHSIRKGDIDPRLPFAEYIQDESVLMPARYHEHLERWLAVFPRERIKVILLEEFLKDQRAGYRDLFAFLGVDPEFVPPGFDEQRNEARAYRFLWLETTLVRTYRWLSRKGHTRLVKRVLDSRFGDLVRWLNASQNGGAPVLDAASREMLVAYFAPHNAKLAECLGRDLSAWDGGGRVSGAERHVPASEISTERENPGAEKGVDPRQSCVQATGTRIVLLIGAPRSGTTMLEHVLSSHSMIHGGPEPHLLTPLAHLGVFRNVNRAPYDQIVAALGQKSFVKRLPREESDYFDACRAYCDVLYTRALAGTGKRVFLDKTPEYVTVLPFITRVLPDAKYVVLSRHPAAIFTSFANSFFDRDFELAYRHDPLLERYVPALAHFLRQKECGFLHLHYEDLVTNPEEWIRRIYQYIGVPHEPSTISYAHKKSEPGLGDPAAVRERDRPTTDSIDTWADELVACPANLACIERQIARLDPRDLETLGYPLETLWLPLQARSPARDRRQKRLKAAWSRYAMERRAIVRGRSLVQQSRSLQHALSSARLLCEVLLREY